MDEAANRKEIKRKESRIKNKRKTKKRITLILVNEYIYIVRIWVRGRGDIRNKGLEGWFSG